jgi:ParB-like nuclease domain
MTDELLYISEGLRSLAVPIDELHIDPANARTKHALDRIAASLKAYGQRKPIIANRLQGGKIEAGNGTWLAAKERLGWSHIAVVYVDDDPATAAAYGIADNRLSELSSWDLDALGALIPSVDELFTGFTEAEIRDLLGERGGGLLVDPGPQDDIVEIKNIRHRFGVGCLPEKPLYANLPFLSLARWARQAWALRDDFMAQLLQSFAFPFVCFPHCSQVGSKCF